MGDVGGKGWGGDAVVRAGLEQKMKLGGGKTTFRLTGEEKRRRGN